MRKLLAVLVSMAAVLTLIGGCTKQLKEVDRPEDPVTLEQVNTEGKYAARAFLESIFANNRDLFVKCYPDGFVEKLEKKSGKDVFEEYKVLTQIKSTMIGTAFDDLRDFTVENGFDPAQMRSGISYATGIEYSDIEAIQLQKIKVFFSNGEEMASSDFYYIVYKTGGKWYVLETYDGNVRF